MDCDFVVIGAGISGAAAALELKALGSVIVLEAESSPGYHSTGRSAALYTPHFGSDVVCAICRASHPFLANPPEGFSATPLLTRRGLLTVAEPERMSALDGLIATSSPPYAMQRLTAEEALARAPLLRPELVGGAVYEDGVMDIEVSNLHQSTLAAFKAKGGTLRCESRIVAIERTNSGWRIETQDGCSTTANIIVNAAGAWADEVARLAGVAPVGLVAKRRTAIVVDAPDGMDVTSLPAIDFIGTDAYVKPEAGRLMASPGDATPVAPQDVQPEEWDVAVLADWLQTNTTVSVRRIEHSWAGLRSFAIDDAPVVGFDAVVPGFFWLAGQGGYGIMMAPVLGRITASLIETGVMPADIASHLSVEQVIAPGRFNKT